MLLLVGVIGGFIPVLQGWVFILAGLTLMAPESERARAALEWAKARVRRNRGERDHDENDSPKTGTETDDA